MTTDRGPWIQTFLGAPFYPFDPRIEEVNIEDVAHALSNECRWGGHAKHFYSVAEHSLAVSTALLPHGPRVALAGLLHDASEAYLRDIPRPIKMHPSFAFYREAEARVQAVIEEALGMPELAAEERELVHAADEQALSNEAYKLLAGGPLGWKPALPPKPLDSYGCPIWPARDAFLLRFRTLKRSL